jgi:NMD protein affecting ribosome stability and mRNA decay
VRTLRATHDLFDQVESMIYAIQCGNDGPIKIGSAARPLQRLADLQVGCPYELRLKASADWPDEIETTIHRFCASSRIRGEWFEPESNRVLTVVFCMQDGAGRQKMDEELAAFIAGQRAAHANRRRDKRMLERLSWWSCRGCRVNEPQAAHA